MSCNSYGADTVRGYLMFIGPWDQGGPWDPQRIEACAVSSTGFGPW